MRFRSRSSPRRCARNLLSLSDEIKGERFEVLAKALGKKFAPAERLELYKAESQARRRMAGEKLDELAASLSKTAGKVFLGAPSDILDGLAMDRFIASLDNADLRIRVRESNPKTLSESLSRVSKTSRVQTVEKSRELRIAEMLNKQTTALEKAVNLLIEHAKTGGNNDHRKSGSKFRKNKEACWKCGGVGHFKPKCPTQDESSQKQGN